MAKHITGYDEKSITNVINNWNKDEKLTQDALCDKLVKVIGKRPSRQSLSSHVKVSDCFNSKRRSSSVVLKKNVLLSLLI